MSYFKIGNTDLSDYVNELKVQTNHNFNSQLNAAGDTLVDYISKKRTIEVGFIPMDDADMKTIMELVEPFNVSISFRNPTTNVLETNVNCIIPSSEIEYYTIQVGRVMYKAYTLTFQEL